MTNANMSNDLTAEQQAFLDRHEEMHRRFAAMSASRPSKVVIASDVTINWRSAMRSYLLPSRKVLACKAKLARKAKRVEKLKQDKYVKEIFGKLPKHVQLVHMKLQAVDVNDMAGLPLWMLQDTSEHFTSSMMREFLEEVNSINEGQQ